MNLPDRERQNGMLASVIWLAGFIVLCFSMVSWVFYRTSLFLLAVLFGFTLMCLGGCIPQSHRGKCHGQ